MTRTNILAGADRTGVPTNPDAQIGVVAVVRDWIASNLIAGGSALPAGSAIVSQIASISIAGQALGTVAPGDRFDFTAQRIGSFKIGTTIFPLTPGASNDVAGLAVGATGDLRVGES